MSYAADHRAGQRRLNDRTRPSACGEFSSWQYYKWKNIFRNGNTNNDSRTDFFRNR